MFPGCAEVLLYTPTSDVESFREAGRDKISATPRRSMSSFDKRDEGMGG